MSVYTWTNKMPKTPTQASGLDKISTSDSKRQIERLRAENAELTKSVIELQQTVRELIESSKAKEKKAGKKDEVQA